MRTRYRRPPALRVVDGRTAAHRPIPTRKRGRRVLVALKAIAWWGALVVASCVAFAVGLFGAAWLWGAV